MNGRYPVLLMVRELGLGGTERQLTETARGLDRSIFEPHVGCFRADGFRAEDLREAGVPVVRFPAGSLMNASTFSGAAFMRRYLREHRIQLVHTFDTPTNLFGVPAAWAFRVPALLSSQRAYRELTPPFGRRLLRLTDRLADGIVVNCKAMERHMVTAEGVPPERVRVCYNGIDTGTFFPDAGEPRPAPIADAQVTIGVVCALRPEKDLPTLVRAFALVRAKRPGLKLVIAGSGSCREELGALAQELGIAADCHFEPAVRNVVPWMRAIDIFVLPSRSEALSNSLMEAMACGCCPVASDVGGNPELVIPMRTGLLFRAGDARELADRLDLLTGRPELRRSLGAEAARTISRDFSLEASARQMGSIYSGFLSRNG